MILRVGDVARKSELRLFRGDNYLLPLQFTPAVGADQAQSRSFVGGAGGLLQSSVQRGDVSVPDLPWIACRKPTQKVVRVPPLMQRRPVVQIMDSSPLCLP